MELPFKSFISIHLSPPRWVGVWWRRCESFAMGLNLPGEYPPVSDTTAQLVMKKYNISLPGYLSKFFKLLCPPWTHVGIIYHTIPYVTCAVSEGIFIVHFTTSGPPGPTVPFTVGRTINISHGNTPGVHTQISRLGVKSLGVKSFV